MDNIFELTIGGNRITLINADSRDIVPNLEPVNCVITDPPYGNTVVTFNQQDVHTLFANIFNNCKKLLPTAANIIVCGDFFFMVWLAQEFKRHFSAPFIWKKSRPIGYLSANKRPLRIIEYIVPMYNRRKGVFNPQKYYDGIIRSVVKKKHRGASCHFSTKNDGNHYSITDNGRFPTDIYEFASVSARGMHPTTKPVALMERLVREFSNAGDTVLDPFCGGGSTLLACAKTGRNAIGIEIDPKYFELTIKKLQQLKDRL